MKNNENIFSEEYVPLQKKIPELMPDPVDGKGNFDLAQYDTGKPRRIIIRGKIIHGTNKD